MDETCLFLHRNQASLAEPQQQILEQLRSSIAKPSILIS